MNKHKVTQKELLEQWNRQVHFIERSVKAFDQGDEAEALRIALAFRILFHETNKSHSLLKQLRRDESYLFYSNMGLYSPGNLLSSWGLLTLQVSEEGPKWLPGLNRQPNERFFLMQFYDWWNEIIFDDKRHCLTRADIVRHIADTDGGAHVDGYLNESYAALTKNNSLGVEDYCGRQPRNNPAYQSMRVLAEEFLISETINSVGLGERREYKDRQFEMRFVDDDRRYKWSSTEISCSEETRGIASKHRCEPRKLYRQSVRDGRVFELIA